MKLLIVKLSQISFFICLIAIEYLATTTTSIPAIENSWDKFNHFIAFITLYILLSLGYQKLIDLKKVIILMIFAIQIEIVQSFIPNRYFSLLDVVADAIGIILGIVVYKFFRNRFSY